MLSQQTDQIAQMTRELIQLTDYKTLLECELEGKTEEMDKIVGELRQCELRKQMSEVERGEYERVIEEQERENSGLKQEVIELRAYISQMKEVKRRIMDSGSAVRNEWDDNLKCCGNDISELEEIDLSKLREMYMQQKSVMKEQITQLEE